jgi:hypothetical protein
LHHLGVAGLVGADVFVRRIFGVAVAVGFNILEPRLSDGYAPQEIAATIGVTDNTVRSQIKAFFAKTESSDMVN